MMTISFLAREALTAAGLAAGRVLDRLLPCGGDLSGEQRLAEWEAENEVAEPAGHPLDCCCMPCMDALGPKHWTAKLRPAQEVPGWEGFTPNCSDIGPVNDAYFKAKAAWDAWDAETGEGLAQAAESADDVWSVQTVEQFDALVARHNESIRERPHDPMHDAEDFDFIQAASGLQVEVAAVLYDHQHANLRCSCTPSKALTCVEFRYHLAAKLLEIGAFPTAVRPRPSGTRRRTEPQK